MALPTREQALDFLKQKLKTPNLVKHCLASEAIMRALARRLGEDEELWGLLGLLHDVDLDEVGADPKRHGLVAADWLREMGFPEEALQALKAHNGDELGVECKARLDYALSAAETLTGMIVAMALVLPSKKLADVKPKSIVKRMDEKRFAAGVRRDRIMLCERLGLPLQDFVALGVSAMQEISDQLGL